MDPVTIMADIALAVKLAKMAYDTGKDMYPYVKTAYEIMFKNKVLTAEERDAMTKQEQLWRSEIDTIIAEDDAATD
jgi:hypothetical protein